MAERRTPIQVPPRQEGESAASPEQLQFIRQLVTGMSLSGFRFDYRKLGTNQAASVIDQLLELRDAGSAAPTRAKGGGCINSLVRGTVRLTVSLIVLLVVIAGVGYGGYLIYEKVNEKSADQGDGEAVAEEGEGAGTDGGAATSGGKRTGDSGNTRETDFFGHKITVEGGGSDDPDDPSDTSTDKPEGADPPEQDDNPPSLPDTPPPPAKPVFSAEALTQLEDLHLVLAQLKTFTRSESKPEHRAESVGWMQKRLTRLSDIMEPVALADPALAGRIKDVINSYAADEIDGQAIRTEIDAIRDQLKALVEGS